MLDMNQRKFKRIYIVYIFSWANISMEFYKMHVFISRNVPIKKVQLKLKSMSFTGRAKRVHRKLVSSN